MEPRLTEAHGFLADPTLAGELSWNRELQSLPHNFPITLNIYRRTRVLGNRLRLLQVRFFTGAPKRRLEPTSKLPNTCSKDDKSGRNHSLDRKTH